MIPTTLPVPLTSFLSHPPVLVCSQCVPISCLVQLTNIVSNRHTHAILSAYEGMLVTRPTTVATPSMWLTTASLCIPETTKRINDPMWINLSGEYHYDSLWIKTPVESRNDPLWILPATQARHPHPRFHRG